MDGAKPDIRAIFCEALDRQSPGELTQYLDTACGDNADLRAQVEELLASHREAGNFLGGASAKTSETSDHPMAEKPGMIIGPYKLRQVIGEGGMGTVYMAEQSEPVERKVAIKVIKAGMDTQQVIARFEAERQALAMMDHANIARVLDVGTTQSGRPFFVMELVHGVPITKYCDDNHLTPRQRLELFVPVCQAIQHAHQKGIIHRDIKPSNVMITLYDGQPVPKVIDFGVAKATEQKLTERTLFTQYGTLVGTLEYMSPEQAEMSALGVDTRSDIFSLGVLLYELLTGSTPLSHKRLKEAAYDEILRMIREEEAPKPSTRLTDSGEALASISAQRHMEPAKLSKLMRGELDWIVMKTLEKDRNRRYETANGFAMDVQRYLNDEAVLACPPSAGYRFRKFARRNRVAITTVALVVATLVLGTVVSTWQAIRATRARHDAEVARTDADQRRIEADEQRQQAEDARKEAITNLQKAREAGEEFFTRVSENRLLEQPGLQSLRQELLEAGVAYYEGLATGKSEDPQAQADLITSRLRLVQIYFHTFSRDQHILALEKGIEGVEEFLRAHPDATSEHLTLAGFFHGGRGVGIERAQPFSDRDRALRVYEQATALWEKLVKRYPTATGFQSDLSKFYSLQGNVQFQVGQREEALRTGQKVREIREQIVRANPGVYEHVAELGHAYQALAGLLEVSDPEAAEALYRQSVTVQKDAPDIVTYQDFLATHRASFGRFLGKRKRPEEAIQLLQESLAIWEKLAGDFPYERIFPIRAERLRGEIRTLRQDTSGTGQVQREDENQSQQQALALLRGLNRDGDAYRAARELQKAEHSYRMAITRFQALPSELSTVSGCRESLMQAYVRLGELFSANEPPEGAEQAYREALEVAQKLASDFPGVPDYRARLANLHRALAQLYSRVGRAQESEQASRQAIDLLAALTAEVPQVEVHWHNLGLVHAQLGQWDQAVAGYTKAIELNPDYWEAWRERGWAHGNLGQWAKAVADHTTAIELKPEAAGAWDGRGWAYARLGQWDKAIADHTKAIELKPGSGHAWHLRGWAHANLGKWDQAVADQTKALELIPKHWWTWYRRAQAYSALKQWDKAIPDYAKAIELGATEAGVWLSKAAAHASLEQSDPARAGQWKAAIDALAKAEESAPSRSFGFNAFFLAMGHWQLDEKEEARKWYDQAVEWTDKNQPKNEQLRRFRAEAAKLLGIENQR